MRIFLTAAACLLTLAAHAQTTIRLTSVPATTPPDATVYIAGSFNSWDPGSAAHSLAKNTDGTYQITLPASVTGKLEFKFTRGSWDKVETSAQQADVSNRTYTVTGAAATVELQVANWKDLGGPGGCTSTALQPNVQVVNASFAMPQLGGRTRRVWIYLPVDYATSARRYPVLYMHDGQNVFDKCTSFSGEWGVDEALRQLQQSGQDPTGTIVVAVDNGGNSRLNEYSPWPNAEYKSGGEGDKYVDFLVETLKPYIDQQYRTLTGREYTGIAGSSMGGLISVYAALKYQNVFSKVGVFSPAFWFAKQPLFDYVKTAGHQQPIKFYFLAGAKESETMVPLMADMRDALQQQGFAAADMSYHVLEDGQHAEWFWQREFPAAFQWLYAPGVVASNGRQYPRVLLGAYPNPVKDWLHLTILSGVERVGVEIRDINSRLVLQLKNFRASDSIDVRRLSKGIYTLRVKAGRHNIEEQKIYKE
ncbi:T9SS type A sorting domain-containing protein [Hymenobacter sp. J193]|uniref:alpha/beta hydrolase-fold protein n=1 Tax=Hymenobacter sp. J193 TaxID=2898429 RepID=UPI0021517AE2|nr:alpha/beta hydrolase-fold protein [Hymenobacter sp. J193]MCR5889565.1 T9SS type A sorting domain-containing protein [Hymenobacter sp. J193]